MTTEELEVIKFFLAAFGWGAITTIVIVGLLFKFYLSSYIMQKGKNLATREDISMITEKIEGVRMQYAMLIEELKARQQLRLAAIDRRLEAHQEAFGHWRKLMSAAHTEEIRGVVIECQSWWDQNCIYLEPKVREGFVTAFNAADMHNGLLRSHEEAKVIRENWTHIRNFPNILFEAVKLPGLSELEATVIGVSDEPPDAGAQ